MIICENRRINPYEFCNFQSAVACGQLKQVEQIANEMISKNEVIYAKDTPLPIAKSIHGLRAVFDEVCLFYKPST